jgi:hypothetical protein
MTQPLGIRWTIGDVSDFGFEALRFSIWGARHAFGPAAELTVVVNSLTVGEARSRTGELPNGVTWAEAGDAPHFLKPFLDSGMAEGVAWKLAPLRLFPDRYEISLDNDCILWEVPETVAAWLDEPQPRCLIAADVRSAFGAFAAVTRAEPRNTGIRGLPPHYDLGGALLRMLEQHPTILRSELDEQGLQAAALDLHRPAQVVSVDEVSICSPFWPHTPQLGRSGAHFVGLNAHSLPWSYYGRPAGQEVQEHWKNKRLEVYRRIGMP